MSQIDSVLFIMLVVAILTLIAGFMFGWMDGFVDGKRDKENELVKSGHAEYYLDKDNNKQWRMKK